MTKAEANLRCNQVWIESRGMIRDVLLACFEQASDFRLSQSRSLLLPVNPVTCSYYDGLNSLFMIHAAYSVYKQTKIFDSRFAMFADYSKHDLRLKKGSHGYNLLQVDGFTRNEVVDMASGEVDYQYQRNEAPRRHYVKVFHTHQLVTPPVPISSAVTNSISIPFKQPSAFDAFIGGWANGAKISVQFTDTLKPTEWDYATKALLVPLPRCFASNEAYIDALVLGLIHLSLPSMPSASLNMTLCSAIAHLLLNNALLLPYRLSVVHSEIIESIETMDETTLFFHALAGEQLSRRILKMSGQIPLVLQAQSQAANQIRHDFFLFSKSEKSGVTASREATLQHSDQQVIKF